MAQALDHIEIRYRRADTVGAWTSAPNIKPGQRSVTVDGVERGLSYQIEARAVGTNGGASVWVQQTHTVANANQQPTPPTSLTALSVADGVHLSWSVTGTQRADVEYDIERTGDVSGAPDPTGWTNIANAKTTAFTDGITDGVVRWYRVRAVDFLGLVSIYSNDVNSNNKSVQDGADVTKDQAIAYAGSSESIVPNGNFLLGNTQGWLGIGFNTGFSGSAPGVYSPAHGSPDGFVSPVFSVKPGAKYRIAFTAYNSVGPGHDGIYFRINYQANFSANVPSTTSIDFLSDGNITTTETVYSYDWTCPADQFYASLAFYCIGTSDLAISSVSCIPYASANEWGADVTFNNTANNTNNVGSLSSGDINATINPGGGVNFANPGNTGSMDDIPDGVSRYAAIELGADNTLNHVVTAVDAQNLGNIQMDNAGIGTPPVSIAVSYTIATFNVIANSTSDVFNLLANINWIGGGNPYPSTVVSSFDGYVDAPAFVGTGPLWGVTQPPSGTYLVFGFGSEGSFFGSVTGLSPGAHTISLVVNNWDFSATPTLGYVYAQIQQISS